jgi:hypothetical protein
VETLPDAPSSTSTFVGHPPNSGLTFPPPTEEEEQAFLAAVRSGDYSAHIPHQPRNGPYLLFDDDRMVYAGDEQILVTEWLIGDYSLTALRNVSRSILRDNLQLGRNEPLIADDDLDPVNFFVVDLPPEDYWSIASDRADIYPDSIVELLVTPWSVRAHFHVTTGADTPLRTVEKVTRSVCVGAHATIDAIEEVFRLSTDVGWAIDIRLRRRGGTAADLIQASRACTAAIGALRGSTFDRETIAALVRAGMPRVLIGIPENEWFEAKSRLWDLGTVAGKIELAQDVARFANAHGGLILVGAETRKVAGADTLKNTRGLDPGRVDLTRITSVLDQRIYPAIEGLAVWSAELEGGRTMVVIDVPPQSDWMKPFLVQGSLVGSRVEGAFFSIVRRRGEGSIALTARDVHAWLAAGRRLTRGDDDDHSS